MHHSVNNEKTKDGKKSFVKRFFSFASHTVRNNKKSEQNNLKKNKKKSNKGVFSITDDKRKISKSLMQIDKEEIQTCTFCDYCDREIVADFTGQDLIYHVSCKENHRSQCRKECNMELQSFEFLSSMKSENIPLAARETSFIDSPEILEKRLSTSLNDISCNGLTISDDITLKLRTNHEPSFEGNSHSNFLSDTGPGTYTFSTVDLSTVKRYGIAIKKVAPQQNDLFCEYVYTPDQATLARRYSNGSTNSSANEPSLFHESLRTMMSIFNNNDQGLSIEPHDDLIIGSIRVFINLLRPVKMLLTARPPSMIDVFPGNGSLLNQSTIDRQYYNREEIFWLPRGTTTVLYININGSTKDVISKLLLKYNIQNNPKKFALYEHTIKSQQEVEVRKLRPLQCPLKIMMDWCTKDLEHFRKNLESKRFVLQENDPGSIEWDVFSVPELKTFLMILGQEEEEKRKSIICKYDILLSEINRRMTLKKNITQETVSVSL